MRVLQFSACDRRMRGSAVLEFSIVLPTLLLIAVGTTDLGRHSHALVAVCNAARVGAQYGSINMGSAEDFTGIEGAVREEMTSVRGANDTNPTVSTLVTNEGSKGTSLKVTVHFQFKLLVNYPGFPSTMTLTRSVSMRVLPN